MVSLHHRFKIAHWVKIKNFPEVSVRYSGTNGGLIQAHDIVEVDFG